MSATLPGANPASLPPAILGQRYRLERKLAQGGMAEVWLGTDLSLTRHVAVKLLKSNLAADPIVAERFRREAIAVAQLSHPNIVAVYDAIDDVIGGARRQAVVMQLVDGKSLRQLLDEQNRLSPELTMHIGICVGAALDCAHRANLVHRDIKPGNILITLDGRVLLTDFGIAKGLDGGDDDLTSPNVMMGTAKYLSPEQVRGRKLDGRADLYSLGLVLYECLAGRVPFLGETDADTALARLNRDPTDITRLRPTLPQGLAALIHRLLALRPSDRYATGAELRTELQRIAGQPKQDYGNDTSRDVSRGTPSRGRPAGPALSGATTLPSATGPGAARRGTPVHGGRAPTPVGGYQPRPGRPAGAAVRADRTPPSTVRPRQQPNRKFEHRAGPSSIVVGVLLVTAFIVAVVLWVTIGRDDPGSNPGSDSVVPGDSTALTALTGSGAADIVSVQTFDPEGTDPEERDDLIANATDGNVATAWTTLCYENRFMSGKTGVGLVADLGSARSGTFTVVLGSAPYQVKVFASAQGTAPGTFGGWGTPIGEFNGLEAQTVSVELTTPARFVLVSFNELGTDAGCTNDNDFRGSIQEMYIA
ncbi:MAG: serine/threonine protein kinase [Actinomycetia bacterium]|nr:serine/threonine protein kinase [Actinomycetes bacterium]